MGREGGVETEMMLMASLDARRRCWMAMGCGCVWWWVWALRWGVRPGGGWMRVRGLDGGEGAGGKVAELQIALGQL